MSQIKSKWTTPERNFHNLLKGKKIKHKMHPTFNGSPDAILLDKKVAIFIDGCFWHGCQKCYKAPVNNRTFWEKKLQNNKERDVKDRRTLNKQGWKVISFWEHELKKDINKCCTKLLKS